MPHSLESDLSKRFDESFRAFPDLGEWLGDSSHVLIRAVQKPDGSQKFIVPEPVTVAGRSPDELLRIEVPIAVSMGEAAKILRKIARDFAETDRFMQDAAAFVDHMLPMPRKGGARR